MTHEEIRAAELQLILDQAALEARRAALAVLIASPLPTSIQ